MDVATQLELIFLEPILSFEKLHGGDINDVYSVSLTNKTYIVKLNKAELFPSMLEKEAKGLTLLGAQQKIKTPEVIKHGIINDFQFLVLEAIESSSATEKLWSLFGKQLAQLHQCTSTQFGLDENNYIGSLIQQNNRLNTWKEFLITQRIQPMLELAVNQGDVNYVEAKIFDAFFKRIDELFPIEKPSLLHGDLWSGNFLIDNNSEPVLIDPAVYYGHREMDIAMMHLFGGFSPHLFNAYNDYYPLEKGWEKRIPYHQLYPLLVHLNLFGRSYWTQIETIVKTLA